MVFKMWLCHVCFKWLAILVVLKRAEKQDKQANKDSTSLILWFIFFVCKLTPTFLLASFDVSTNYRLVKTSLFVISALHMKGSVRDREFGLSSWTIESYSFSFS